MTNFGDLAYSEGSRYREEEIYDDEDTYPSETDDYELWWAKRRLRSSLQKSEKW